MRAFISFSSSWAQTIPLDPLKTPVVSARKTALRGNFFATLYKANWRNIIIALAGLNGLRYAFATYNAIADAATDDLEAEERLFRVSIALCVMYLVAFIVQIYGIFSVSLASQLFCSENASTDKTAAPPPTRSDLSPPLFPFLHAHRLNRHCPMRGLFFPG